MMVMAKWNIPAWMHNDVKSLYNWSGISTFINENIPQILLKHDIYQHNQEKEKQQNKWAGNMQIRKFILNDLRHYLWTQRSLLMEIAIDKITVLTGGNTTFTIDTSTTRMTDYLAYHMLGCVILKAEVLRKWISLPTNWPFGNVIGPFVWCYGGWRIAVFGI